MASASKKLLKELPSEAVMRSTLLSMFHGPDAAFAITAVSYLDHGLETMLLAAFRQLTPEDYRRLFDGSTGGLMAGTNAKIRVAYAMSLISERLYKDLLILNDIRNVFGHTLHTIDFKNELIIQDCEKLSARSESAIPEEIKTSKDMFLLSFFDCYLSFFRKYKELNEAKAGA